MSENIVINELKCQGGEKFYTKPPKPAIQSSVEINSTEVSSFSFALEYNC